MKRFPGMVVAVVLGIALGAWIRASVTDTPPTPTPGRTMLDLFETYCLPVGQGLPQPDLTDLEPLEIVPGEVQWVDPASGLAVHVARVFDKPTCRVSEFVGTLTRSERDLVNEGIGTLVSAEFPELVAHHSVDSLGQYWMIGQPATRDRWGISIMDVEADGPSFVVMMAPHPAVVQMPE